jgi:hypothetical protein
MATSRAFCQWDYGPKNPTKTTIPVTRVGLSKALIGLDIAYVKYGYIAFAKGVLE